MPFSPPACPFYPHFLPSCLLFPSLCAWLAACLPALCSPHCVPGCLQVRLVDVHAGAEARMEGHEAAQTKLKVMIHQLESQLKVSAGPP